MCLLRSLAACLLPLLALPGGAPAQDGGPAPTGVRAGHPRLFVPPDRLPAIARRASGRLAQAYRGHLKRDCDEPFDERRLEFTSGNSRVLLARTLALLLCWRLEQAPAYREKVLALLERVMQTGAGPTRRDARVRLQALSLAYDWLHDSLDEKARSRLRGEILSRFSELEGALQVDTEFVSGHSHFTTATLLLAALAAHDGSEAAEERLRRALDHWAGYLRVAAIVGADGGHHLGWRYGRSYAARIAWTEEAIATATGAARFETSRSWLSQLGYHWLYGLRPDGTFLRVGDTHRRVALNLDEDVVGLGILSARYRDPHLAGLAWRALEMCGGSAALAHPAEHVWALLFLDPEVPPKGPEGLPLVRAFRQAGNYILRTGWGEGDTLVLFRAMPWYHFNHERRDFSSFQIYHRGALAIASGAYLAGDDDSDYGGSHLVNYAWRTVAHNTITVLDPRERFCSPTGPGSARCEGENRWSNDGGQRIRSTRDAVDPVPNFQPRDERDLADPRFQQGEVLAFLDRPELSYIRADATRAYDPRKLRRFERHFFFLKRVAGWEQPVVVVLDDVVSIDPAHRKTWNLHCVEPPAIRDRSAVFTNTTRVRLAGDVRPGRGDPWISYEGKLHCQTLLPADARLELIAGEGREFWVDGRNHEASIREVDRVIEPGIGRLEVTPGAPRAADVFLHALLPCGAGDGRPLPAARALAAEGALAGIEIGDHVLVAALPGEAPIVRYRLEGQGARVHAITCLPPDVELSLRAGSQAPVRLRASPEGVLIFRSSEAGEHAVSAGGGR